MAVRTSSYCQAAATDTATYSDLDSSFTPPAPCLKPTYTIAPEGYDRHGFELYTDTTTQDELTVPYLVRGRNPTCFPKNFPISICDDTVAVDAQTKFPRSEATYLYSPGRCPEHYLIVESAVDSSRGDLTRALCCPS